MEEGRFLFNFFNMLLGKKTPPGRTKRNETNDKLGRETKLQVFFFLNAPISFDPGFLFFFLFFTFDLTLTEFVCVCARGVFDPCFNFFFCGGRF